MADHFIPLSCKYCGANLQVYDDMEYFACGHCGTALIVQRRGGTVNLRGVTQAIQKVQVGTDKTAAELALVRLNGELEAVLREHGLLCADEARSNNNLFLLWLFLLLFGLCGFASPEQPI